MRKHRRAMKINKKKLKATMKTIRKSKKTLRNARKALSAAKALFKAISKKAAKETAKKAGKSALKKVPGVGFLAGLVFGFGRATEGDWAGAVGEVASGAVGTVPGVGTGLSVAIDAALMGKDLYEEYQQAEREQKRTRDEVNRLEAEQKAAEAEEKDLRQQQEKMQKKFEEEERKRAEKEQALDTIAELIQDFQEYELVHYHDDDDDDDDDDVHEVLGLEPAVRLTEELRDFRLLTASRKFDEKTSHILVDQLIKPSKVVGEEAIRKCVLDAGYGEDEHFKLVKKVLDEEEVNNNLIIGGSQA